jgi:hypothetical protein
MRYLFSVSLLTKLFFLGSLLSSSLSFACSSSQNASIELKSFNATLRLKDAEKKLSASVEKFQRLDSEFVALKIGIEDEKALLELRSIRELILKRAATAESAELDESDAQSDMKSAALSAEHWAQKAQKSVLDDVQMQLVSSTAGSKTLAIEIYEEHIDFNDDIAKLRRRMEIGYEKRHREYTEGVERRKRERNYDGRLADLHQARYDVNVAKQELEKARNDLDAEVRAFIRHTVAKPVYEKYFSNRVAILKHKAISFLEASKQATFVDASRAGNGEEKSPVPLPQALPIEESVSFPFFGTMAAAEESGPGIEYVREVFEINGLKKGQTAYCHSDIKFRQHFKPVPCTVLALFTLTDGSYRASVLMPSRSDELRQLYLTPDGQSVQMPL